MVVCSRLRSSRTRPLRYQSPDRRTANSRGLQASRTSVGTKKRETVRPQTAGTSSTAGRSRVAAATSCDPRLVLALVLGVALGLAVVLTGHFGASGVTL